jgi:hypothetical protein
MFPSLSKRLLVPPGDGNDALPSPAAGRVPHSMRSIEWDEKNFGKYFISDWNLKRKLAYE